MYNNVDFEDPFFTTNLKCWWIKNRLSLESEDKRECFKICGKLNVMLQNYILRDNLMEGFWIIRLLSELTFLCTKDVCCTIEILLQNVPYTSYPLIGGIFSSGKIARDSMTMSSYLFVGCKVFPCFSQNNSWRLQRLWDLLLMTIVLNNNKFKNQFFSNLI